MDKLAEMVEAFQKFYPNLQEIIRNDFDSYAMWQAFNIQSRSKCLSRGIGCVVVKDKHIIATGYNGPTRNYPHPIVCKRKELGIPPGQRLELCNCAHSELNAICQAACHGHSTQGSTIYLVFIPCTLICSPAIIGAGISKVVCLQKEEYLNDSEAVTALEKFRYAGVEVEVYQGQLRAFFNAIQAGGRNCTVR